MAATRELATQPGRPGPFTYEDLGNTPNDGRRYEVLEGELVASPSPKTSQQLIITNLLAFLLKARDGRHGTLLTAPVDVVFGDQDVAQPDVVFVSRTRAAVLTEASIQGAPDLVVEVLSEGTRRRDVLTKRRLYERYGVPFYWIVDPEEEEVRVYELRERAYGEPVRLRGAQALTCALFPGIEEEVGRLFRHD